MSSLKGSFNSSSAFAGNALSAFVSKSPSAGMNGRLDAFQATFPNQNFQIAPVHASGTPNAGAAGAAGIARQNLLSAEGNMQQVQMMRSQMQNLAAETLNEINNVAHETTGMGLATLYPEAFSANSDGGVYMNAAMESVNGLGTIATMGQTFMNDDFLADARSHFSNASEARAAMDDHVRSVANSPNENMSPTIVQAFQTIAEMDDNGMRDYVTGLKRMAAGENTYGFSHDFDDAMQAEATLEEFTASNQQIINDIETAMAPETPDIDAGSVILASQSLEDLKGVTPEPTIGNVTIDTLSQTAKEITQSLKDAAPSWNNEPDPRMLEMASAPSMGTSPAY